MVTKEGGYIIHLDSATERSTAIEALQRTFFMPLVVTPASNGEAWMRDATVSKRHVLAGQQVTQGMLGCAESHMNLLSRGLHEGLDELAIFEEDCEFVVGGHTVKEWVDGVRASGVPWDILLLGANEYVNQPPVPTVVGGAVKVGRFWGTHAMLVRARAAEAAIRTFTQSQKEGFFLPADWMYNEAIRREGLVVFGPPSPKALCRQIPGLVSAITGKVRG